MTNIFPNNYFSILYELIFFYCILGFGFFAISSLLIVFPLTQKFIKTEEDEELINDLTGLTLVCSVFWPLSLILLIGVLFVLFFKYFFKGTKLIFDLIKNN
jgi:hypothetical protein